MAILTTTFKDLHTVNIPLVPQRFLAIVDRDDILARDELDKVKLSMDAITSSYGGDVVTAPLTILEI